MTSSNNPKNQKTEVLGNLGQITLGQEPFKTLTVDELNDLPEAEYLAYCQQAFYMPPSGRTIEEINASSTEILMELNGWNALKNCEDY